MLPAIRNFEAGIGSLASQKSWKFLTAVLLGGWILSAALAIWVHARDVEAQAAEFQRRAVTQQLALQRTLAVELEIIEAVAALFEASESVEAEEFSRFATRWLARHESLGALEWAPRIQRADRVFYEVSMAAELGDPDFRIRQRNPTGLEPAGDRELWFPVTFVVPLEDNKSALGFDLASEPRRAEMLQAAMSSGKQRSSEPLRLVQDPKGGLAILTVRPVYFGDPQSPEAREQALQGFVVAIHSVDSIVQQGLPELDADRIELRLFDRSAEFGMRQVYGKALTGEDPWFEGSIALPGRSLLLQATPGPDFLDEQASNRPWWFLLGGVMLTGLLGTWLLRVQSQASEIELLANELEHRVSARTAELARANNQLMEEVRVRGRTQEALRETTLRLRALLESFPGAIWTTDPRGRVRSAAGACSVGLSLGPDAIDKLLSGRAALAPAMDKVLSAHEKARGGEPATWEMTVAGRDYEGRATPVPESSGGGVLAVVLDVTDTRAMEHVRLGYDLHEAHRLESLGLLAGGIAHRFNNLLVGILGQAEFAASHLVENDSAREPLLRIEATAQQAADLTRQMLAYSGRSVFVVEAVDMSALVGEVGQLLHSSLPPAVSLEMVLDDDLPLVAGDATQLAQLVMGLVTSAADSAGEHGGHITLTISCRDKDDGPLEHAALKAETPELDWVMVEVKDDGPGMNPESRARIFDPAISMAPGDVGVGMGIALGLVRAHQGDIAVQSEEGVGTTVTVLLPSCETPDPAVEATPARAPDPRGGTTVLVIDDEPVVRQFVSQALQSSGLKVLVAEDGDTGLELFRTHGETVDVVLLDVVMPGKTGDVVLRELREIRPGLPVILSSGYAENEAVSRFDGPTPSAFLQKPYRFAQLLSAIEEQVGRHPS